MEIEIASRERVETESACRERVETERARRERVETERATEKKMRHKLEMRRERRGRKKRMRVREETRARKKMRFAGADDETADISQMILLRQNRILDVQEVGEIECIKVDYRSKPDKTYMHPAYAIIAWDDSDSNSNSELFISPFDKEDERYNFKPPIPDEKKVDDGLAQMLPFPLDAHRCRGSNNVIWESKLFFISGRGPFSGHHCTNSVLAFDLVDQTWITHYKPIQTPRAFHTVVAVKDIMYVFGNSPLNPIPEDHWGEQFDIQQNEWKYLPTPPKPLYKLHQSRAHAVYYSCHPFFYTTRAQDKSRRCFVPPHQNLILFPLPDAASPISVFNCNTNQWLPDIYPNLRHHLIRVYPHGIKSFRDRQVVIDGVLFWHFDGSIHGYDFLDEKCLPTLFTVPFRKLHKPHGYDDGRGCCFPPMYLVHIGDHKLFLFFQVECKNDRIHCFRFEIQRNKRGRPRHLDPEPYSRISTKSINQNALQDVLLIPSRLGEM